MSTWRAVILVPTTHNLIAGSRGEAETIVHRIIQELQKSSPPPVLHSLEKQPCSFMTSPAHPECYVSPEQPSVA